MYPMQQVWVFKKSRACNPFMVLIATTVLLHSAGALSQSFCSSDATAPGTTLHERFISADCELCWSAPASTQNATGQHPAASSVAFSSAGSATASSITLDWILPSLQGDDAPLAAAALRESRWRLDSIGATQKSQQAVTSRVRASKPQSPATSGPPAVAIRVAHGLALNGYTGASISVTLSPQNAAQMRRRAGPSWTVWLALVEQLPGGAEGTQIPRNLVRNLLKATWNIRIPLLNAEQVMFTESRPLSIPESSRAERLAVVGWVTDGAGRLQAVAQSRCEPSPP